MLTKASFLTPSAIKAGAYIPNISGGDAKYFRTDFQGSVSTRPLFNYINISILYIGRSGTELVSSDIHFWDWLLTDCEKLGGISLPHTPQCAPLDKSKTCGVLLMTAYVWSIIWCLMPEIRNILPIRYTVSGEAAAGLRPPLPGLYAYIYKERWKKRFCHDKALVGHDFFYNVTVGLLCNSYKNSYIFVHVEYCYCGWNIRVKRQLT